MTPWSELCDPVRLAVAPTLTAETLAQRNHLAAAMLRRFEAKRSPPPPRKPGGARHQFKFRPKPEPPKPEPPPKIRKPPSPALLAHLARLNAARRAGSLLSS
jgi:hypothetical protein